MIRAVALRRSLAAPSAKSLSRCLRASLSSASDWTPSERPTRPLFRRDSEMMLARTDSIEREVHGRSASLETMLESQNTAASKEVVPWFLDNMPPAYFRQVSPVLQEQHLRALVALHGSGAVPEMSLKSQDGTVTLIRPGNYPGQLLSMLRQIPAVRPLSSVKVFTSKDETVAINVFGFADSSEEGFNMVPPALLEYAAQLQAGVYKDDPDHAAASPIFEPEALEDYVRRCQPAYVANSSPRRFCKQMQMYDNVLRRGTDEIAIDIENGWAGTESSMITLALTNVWPIAALTKIGRYLGEQNVDIVRTHLDVVLAPGDGTVAVVASEEDATASLEAFSPRGNVALLRVLVSPFQDEATGAWSSPSALAERMKAELPRLAKWLDDDTIDMMLAHPSMDAREAETITMLCALTHATLASRDPYAFVRSRVNEVVNGEQQLPIVRAVAGMLLRRFDPDPAGGTYDEREAALLATANELRAEIDSSIELTDTRTMLHQMVQIALGTLRTNAFVESRFSLAVRLEPSVCVNQSDELRNAEPFGVYFIHGRRFNGFQVRFRDIARGGLRVVTPPNAELLSVESGRQFNECYDLAFAQQLKNKDIAEGGSKAVCLVNINNDRNFSEHSAESHNHIVRKSVKAFTDGLLDLISPCPEKGAALLTRKPELDRLHGAEELVYLGPDEQIIPDDIDWIIERAAQRGYPIPAAFMSSKPAAGINHKEYGVTSEGVAVFLDVALDAMGIPKTEEGGGFSVKITGGPDGDVAGNMLSILHREYGDACRVVGMADGTACLEDPAGLPFDELLRLFNDAQPLASFDTARLRSGEGKLLTVDTSEGLFARNTMHNRVEADAFVTAGGRPGTINDSNWEAYLLPDGTPSARLIVEGANLFLTHGAREALSRTAGVVVVKDSSANKCGVICSSFEIIASMLLRDEAEFLSIKDKVVADVLVRLRQLARREAELLFREYKRAPTAPLPPTSEAISRAIIRTSDAVSDALGANPTLHAELVAPLVRKHIPSHLADAAFERFADRVPLSYTRELTASVLASEIVYREGIHYIESLSDGALAPTAFEYMQHYHEVHRLADALESKEMAGIAGLSDADRANAAALLRRGGARTAVEFSGL